MPPLLMEATSLFDLFVVAVGRWLTYIGSIADSS